jgi:thymidylate synthase
MWNKHTHEDGTLFTKEEFLQKLKTDKEFNNEFGNKGIDQISELIRLLKETPDSRRMVVNAWAVHDLPHQVLPPCHYGFQVYTRELSFEERHMIWHNEGKKANVSPLMESQLSDMLDRENIPTRAISLMWNQRSVDTPLGLPFNISSYGLLLEIIAKTVNMVPDELIGNLGDCHIYLNQIEGVKEQLGRELSFEERRDLMVKYTQDNNLLPIPYILPFGEESKNKYLEICDKYKIPKRTREPYPLPTLKHMKTDEFYKSLGEDLSLFTHLDNTDFVVENYQSHPKIYFPLSN